MPYLLDTDICIYLIKQQDERLIARCASFPSQELGLSVITYCELMFGVHHSQRLQQNQQALQQFLRPFHILPLEENVADCYGKARHALHEAGQMIGANDLLIAAHALILKRTLVTNNTREFSRIPGLRVENWAL